MKHTADEAQQFVFTIVGGQEGVIASAVLLVTTSTVRIFNHGVDHSSLSPIR